VIRYYLVPADVHWEQVVMKAVLDRHVIADSHDIVEDSGYQYFPASDVRLDWVEKSPKTAKDLECPHSVQFYDVVIGGERHERNAWVYEKPQPSKAGIGQRFGFWKDVKVG
jgi:uncharacterized protein (DUF427 family)